MADYGQYLPPTDVDSKWVQQKIDATKKELWRLESILERLNKK